VTVFVRKQDLHGCKHSAENKTGYLIKNKIEITGYKVSVFLFKDRNDLNYSVPAVFPLPGSFKW